MNDDTRVEQDPLGDVPVPAEALHGAHTERALADVPPPRRPVHGALARAYGTVKLACVLTNRALGAWATDEAKADALERACRELSDGLLTSAIVVDRLQGAAGTSLNMNVNEVLANRSLQILGTPLGTYSRVSPLDDVGLHQSANDTFPTALRLATISMVRELEEQVVALQEAFQRKEQEFAAVIKVGRTQYQDTVPTTLGREMGAYAEALNRDRWRISTCSERLRVVNLGGTVIGTGFCAPREYVFRVVDTLREITGIGFARAENLAEATQNADDYCEVSGILKTHAVNLLKICGDLRLLSSGPDAGLGEIRLPRRLPGSRLTPGRNAPVIPDAVTQTALLVIGRDTSISVAAGLGSLEQNAFLPLVAACLLDNLEDLARACLMLRRSCVEGIEADEARCAAYVHSSSAAALALLPSIGAEAARAAVDKAKARGMTIREVVVADGTLTAAAYDELLSPEAVGRIGTQQRLGRGVED